MADVVDKATRSRMMAGIRSRNTRPEVALRSALHRLGLRFRIHDKRLPGRPDLVFPKHRAVVQVHGCFWHRHPGCRFATSPASNATFWETKFDSNVTRDRRTEEALEKLGWKVLTVWECDVRSLGAPAVAIDVRHWLLRPSITLVREADECRP